MPQNVEEIDNAADDERAGSTAGAPATADDNEASDHNSKPESNGAEAGDDGDNATALMRLANDSRNRKVQHHLKRYLRQCFSALKVGFLLSGGAREPT